MPSLILRLDASFISQTLGYMPSLATGCKESCTLSYPASLSRLTCLSRHSCRMYRQETGAVEHWRYAVMCA